MCHPGYTGNGTHCIGWSTCTCAHCASFMYTCIVCVSSFALICFASFYSLCTDIDECTLDNGECAEVCNNVEGSYYCSCNESGYEVIMNNEPCQG